MNRIARESERAARARVRAQTAQSREQDRRERLNEKLAKQTFYEGRVAQVEEENRRLNDTVTQLEGILRNGLKRNPSVDLSSLYQHPTEQELDSQLELRVAHRPLEQDFSPIPPGFFMRMIPSVVKSYEAKLAIAKTNYSQAAAAHAASLQRRKLALADLESKTARHNQEIDQFKTALADAKADAVVAYYEMALGRSEYPAGFPQEYRIAFSQESKQLVVDVRLPTMADIVPTVERFKYVKTTNQINETRKSEKSRQALYLNAISQTALRCLHEVFKADPGSIVDVIALNGYVATIDPSTGMDIKPYIISVRISRDEFSNLDLRQVDPPSCLKRLHASVSRSPSELVAIKPIVDINMFDPRFVQEQDVLSTLDARPNLMELTPGEFESLITNLFQKMGLETKLTQASRDGGVDCVAYDSRPVLGGKVIVQAKRYKNTVGVSAVRDLFGTVHNEGASKGILVTTSGYGKAAFDFANGKPLELITGSNLLYMLKEHSGIDAKIVMPDDWVDPQGGA